MNKVVAFLFSLTIVVYLGSSALFAQGRGPGAAAASQGHGPAASHPEGRPVPHGAKSDDVKDAGKQAQETRKDEKADEKIVDHIDSNPQVKAKIESLLPAGMDLKTGALGFHNRGQFIAALHVSKNLNIPFDQLKTKMTGDHAVSLGKAIQELRPDLSEKQAKDEAEKAEKQAKETEKTSKSIT